MSAVRDWLEAIGLGQYADAFEANDIDTDLLAQIDDQVLKDIGVLSAGHRLRLRNAIAKLAPTSIVRADATSAVAAAEVSATSAERRQLTVMFCDLVGSTALAAQLDPEDLHEIIARYHACVTQTVVWYRGFVAKYMGDGVLVYFGYPQAHEYDPEQAVRTGPCPRRCRWRAPGATAVAGAGRYRHRSSRCRRPDRRGRSPRAR
jgi:class 3 adenylate cyclase